MAISRIFMIVVFGAVSYAYGTVVFLRLLAGDGVNFSMTEVKGWILAMVAALLVYGASSLLALNRLARHLLGALARYGIHVSHDRSTRSVNWPGLATLEPEIRKKIVLGVKLALRDCVWIFSVAGIISASAVYLILRFYESISPIAGTKLQSIAVIVLIATAHLWSHFMSAGFIMSGNALFSDTEMRHLFWEAQGVQR